MLGHTSNLPRHLEFNNPAVNKKQDRKHIHTLVCPFGTLFSTDYMFAHLPLQVVYRQAWNGMTSVLETNKTSVELQIPTGDNYLIEIKALSEGGEGSSGGPVHIPKMSSKFPTLCGMYVIGAGIMQMCCLANPTCDWYCLSAFLELAQENPRRNLTKAQTDFWEEDMGKRIATHCGKSKNSFLKIKTLSHQGLTCFSIQKYK